MKTEYVFQGLNSPYAKFDNVNRKTTPKNLQLGGKGKRATALNRK